MSPCGTLEGHPDGLQKVGKLAREKEHEVAAIVTQRVGKARSLTGVRGEEALPLR